MHKFKISGNDKIKINYDGNTLAFCIDTDFYTILVNGPYQTHENYFYINHKSNIYDFKELENIKYDLDPFSLVKIDTFLKNFETGSYIVYQLLGNFDIVESNENNICKIYTSNENNKIIHFTNSIKNLNKEKVNLFEEKIINGESPVVLVYSKTYAENELEHLFFVLNGNEILKAYQNLKIEPKLIAIVNYSETEYENSSEDLLKIIASFSEIKETCIKYFYPNYKD